MARRLIPVVSDPAILHCISTIEITSRSLKYDDGLLHIDGQVAHDLALLILNTLGIFFLLLAKKPEEIAALFSVIKPIIVAHSFLDQLERLELAKVLQ